MPILSQLLFQLIIIVIQIDVAIECSAMAQTATVAPNTTLAYSATVALNAFQAGTACESILKSVEMTKNLRLEISCKSMAALKLHSFEPLVALRMN
jgi:hypothetical protein